MAILFVTTGTIAVTNGSPIVVGTGTGWLTTSVKAGDTMQIAGVQYWVEALNVADQEITLIVNYAGATASGLSYAIMPTSPEWVTNITINQHLAAEILTLSGVVAEAEGFADNSEASATASAASAAAALVSENNAEVAELNAADSATDADASATAASGSATAANAAKILAEVAQVAAEDARDAAEVLYEQFGDQWLGSQAANPTTDLDGDALTDGDLYWNNVAKEFRVYDLGTTTWIGLSAGGSASLISYTPTGGISSSNVQAAITELDSEKLPKSALPSSAVANAIALYDGTSGQVIKDSGITIVDEDDMSSNSAAALPTQQSVKAYVDTEIAGVDVTSALDPLRVAQMVSMLVQADAINVPIWTDHFFADSFETLTYVDVAGATNLDTGTAGSLKPTTASGGIDGNTGLMLHFDGANGSTTFTDSSSSPLTVSAVGNAQITTAQSKFGGASLVLDGTGDRAEVTSAAAVQFGTGSFTIDFWVRRNGAQTGRTIIGNRRDGGAPTGWQIRISLGGNVDFGKDGAIVISGSSGLTDATWHHIAAVRNGTSLVLYKDGVSIGSATDSTDYGETASIYIGMDSNADDGAFNGWLDELRLSKGVARWTAGFTPPVAAYEAPSTNNLIVESKDYIAASAPTRMQVIMFIREEVAAVAGTDYSLKLTRDDAAYGSDVTLTEMYSLTLADASVVRVVRTDLEDVSGLASGTEPGWRFQTLTGKLVYPMGAVTFHE